MISFSRASVATVALLAGLTAAVAAPGTSAQASSRRSTRPSIQQVSPRFLPLAGRRVTITGHHLRHVRSVTFGGVRGRKVYVLSSTKLTVLAPKHATGRAAVKVRTRAGTSRARYVIYRRGLTWHGGTIPWSGESGDPHVSCATAN